MRRTMLVLDNLGPHDPDARYDHPPGMSLSSYDHPFFGQIFLAAILGMIGYPNSLLSSAEVDVHSIEMLYLVPRVVMGLLAVLDTFLLYKIAEYRYGRNVALAASIIFAVTPLSWLSRWILLDSILLPFLLASILLAVYIKRLKRSGTNLRTNGVDSSIKISILLSGILLGLAIYTKIPVFTMVPLVGYLVYKNSNSFKALGFWFIPVILIPAMWPAYSISVGQFDEWIHGVLWQGTQRHTGNVLPDIKLNELLKADPILIVVGAAGAAFAALRKDFFLLLWLVPYIIFFAVIGWVILFHWVPLLPAFSIGVGVLLKRLAQGISKKRTIQNAIVTIAILSIGFFGLVSSSMLITNNFSSSEFEAAAFVSKYMQNENYDNNNIVKSPHENITLITSPIYSWIFKFVLDKDLVSSHIRDPIPINTRNALLMADGVYQSFISKEDQEDRQQFDRIQMIYKNTRIAATFDSNSRYYNFVKNMYPYNSLISYSWAKPILIKANY